MGVFKLQQLLVANEANFGEFGETGTPTWTANLPIENATLETPQERTDDAGMQARLNARSPGHPNVRSGKLTFTVPIIGHGTTAAGALAANWQHTLVKDALGGTNAADVGTTISGASTTTSFAVTTPNAVAAGSVIRVGIKGDARGDGQAYAINSATGPYTVYNAAPGAPTVTLPDVVYATLQAFYSEGATLTTKRFMMLHQDTGDQLALFGCQCSALSLDFPFGASGKPTMIFEYMGANWRRIATTFPNTTARDNANYGPVAGGSFAIQDVGTTARTVKTPTRLDVSLGLGLSPTYGPPVAGDAGTYQNITGWVRTGIDIRVNFQVPWETTWETWWDTANQSITYKQAMFTMNPTDSKAFAIYFPSLQPSGARPSGAIAVNEQTYVDVHCQARDGAVTTSEHTRNVKFCWG